MSLDIRPSIERLVKLYEAWGKSDEAAEWRAKLPAGTTSGEHAEVDGIERD